MKRLTLSGDACVETLALLITMAWADGRLDDAEKKGLRAAADVFNLTKELRERLDGLMEAPMPVDQILVEQLTPKDRAFAYVAATWMTGVDDDIDAKEVALLSEIALLFQLSPGAQQELAKVARDLEHLRKKGADANWSDEVVALFKAIPARLEGDEEIDVVFGS